MFQFPGFALCVCRVTVLQTAGLSHSEIPGSMVICTYPGLIAAYHVLHRLHEPRHPPCALYYFLYDIKSHSRNLMVTLTSLVARSNYEPEPLILSAVLIVKYSSSSLKALRSTSLKLNLSLTFYSLSCVNMSKISFQFIVHSA